MAIVWRSDINLKFVKIKTKELKINTKWIPKVSFYIHYAPIHKIVIKKKTNWLFNQIIKNEHLLTVGIIMQKFKMQLNKSGIQRDNRLKMQSYELTHMLHMLAGYEAVFIRCITLSRDLQLLWRIIDFHLEHTYHFFLWMTLSLQHGKTFKSVLFDEKFF